MKRTILIATLFNVASLWAQEPAIPESTTVIPELSPIEHMHRPNVIVTVVQAGQDGNIFEPYTCISRACSIKTKKETQ